MSCSLTVVDLTLESEIYMARQTAYMSRSRVLGIYVIFMEARD